MKRLRRRGLYDYNKKGWRTFYENHEGKIVFEKGLKTNREVREIVSENLGVKRKEDIINKKQSKTIAKNYFERAEAQSEIDKLLKKKRLSKTDKIELIKKHTATSYKQDAVIKRIQPKKKKTIPKEDIDEIREFELFCTFQNETSPQFFASKQSLQKRKKGGKIKYGDYHGFKEIKRGFDRFEKDDDVYIKFMGLEKKVKRGAFKSVNAFNKYIKESFISGRGKMQYTKGIENLILTGIKKK